MADAFDGSTLVVVDNVDGESEVWALTGDLSVPVRDRDRQAQRWRTAQGGR